MSKEITSYFEKINNAVAECEEEIVDMELTDDAREIIPRDELSLVQANMIDFEKQSRKSEIVKKVQFPDDCGITSDNDGTDEEFFEARQNMSEMSLAVIEKLSSSSMLIDSENLKNSEREREKRDDFGSTSAENSEARPQNGALTSSTSRVVMMVVVEKNGRFNASELAPLIDSSLKKLEIVDATGNPVESTSRNKEKSQSVTSVVSVDSFMSISSVERYETSNSMASIPKSPRKKSCNAVVESGGFFAAMAQAMKIAFRNLPGANTLINLSRDCIEPRKNLSLLSSITESSIESANVLTSLASSQASRSVKRSRDADEISPGQSSVSPDSVKNARSPLPKRPRGWKIRAREPIARMRNNNSLTSLRRVDSSVGDKILPIRSQTHQSTQTDLI